MDHVFDNIGSGRTVKTVRLRTDIVAVDIYVNVYELKNKVGGLDRKVCGGRLTRLRAIGLVTTRGNPVLLVYIVGFKIKHRQEIVSY